ncbi:esterase family protein [Thermoplasma sp.]|uniref:alpha/beta hydrolase n=1 Tax=Thermoplasma sp. TaxID=1973142 RepID=UPI00128A315C|nr:alpha/beta hydrolase-fold protein [Thermoplasma sp.]KAA8921871.1 MAG: esterase family protein [Thermoplasma sp.]
MKTEIIEFESDALKNNYLGDDYRRQILVYTPDDMDDSCPLMIELAGTNWKPRLHNKFAGVVERLFSQGLKAVIINPNFSTKYNMNQYINSPAVGNYEDFIIKEIIPHFKERYSTGKTALFGKSSGGFGSYTLAVRHPDVINGFADHFGDSCFFYLYADDFAYTYNQLQKSGMKELLNRLLSKKPTDEEMRALNVFGSSAFYSPDLDSDYGFDLPFDIETGEILDEIWAKWKDLDPAKNVDLNLEILKKMDAIYIDVGDADEYHLYVGSRVLHRKLAAGGVKHHYEEFQGGHFGNSERYLVSIPFLYDMLRIRE